MVIYPSPIISGLEVVQNIGDGYTTFIRWHKAKHIVKTNKIAYHIYYSTVKENIFSEGVKLVSIDGYTSANIIGLIPGQIYFYCVRPVEYDPLIFDLKNILPIAYDNLRLYPNSLLRQNISATDLIIPLVDISGFPNSGVIKIGAELIRYSSIDLLNKNLNAPANIPGGNPYLIDQGGGNFYTPLASNIGDGYISELSIVSGASAPAETWTIKCIFVQRNSLNVPIAGTAKFEAIGSLSGCKLDGYGNQFIWMSNSASVSNKILKFSITDVGDTFREGDAFIIKVGAPSAAISGGRGYNNTLITSHTINGFDGYDLWDPGISLFTLGEDNMWDNIIACQTRFEYPNYQYTKTDGYHQVIKDILSSDLSASDAANINFPMYDYAGYHRADPVATIDGTCTGSYIGGEMGCIDKFGNYNIVRGISLQDHNNQRQEMLLSVTGRDAVLIKRVQTGITCSCYLPSSEYHDDRCPRCFGSKFVIGWEQYFNPRSSNGRIRVRVGAAPENLKMHEAGLESEFTLDMWTLTVPTIKTRDIIILFDQDDNEEFRYEVAEVTRNNTMLGLQGGQKFKAIRIRKFDPAYQITAFRNTATMPTKINTDIGFLAGIPHTHTIVKNENDPSTWQQLTSISQGHNHQVIIVNGLPTVTETLSHTHKIIL